ncbi:SDR family NAD(P)-dependent oxidoreductase [Algoriphagus lutimaris]|uniref:SDR family NAD(P)-dependent oxidoreductase n=1 Tax=Algoriphagus lutimaris TaxID=613197 RepID=UPI00196B80F8|nr:SDR family NAD(P)-dependent oxidoreductase [Algoriphagus lutimaris]MBN3518887.1 SDR family NAD(P)-dependent oxidoreductase [Algoriphagus lutimaris]
MNLVITGSTSGIGLETVKALYPLFDKLILPVRNLEKAKKLVSRFDNPEKFDCLEMDLSSMKSVHKAGKQITDSYDQIDLLINNAGGMFPNSKKTKEGLDWSFAVNHLGHFHLSQLLLQNLIQAKGKVVFVSSEFHRLGSVKLNDMGLHNGTSSWKNYSDVKLYNILTTNKLHTLYSEKGLASYSLHPGAVNTSFGSESDLLSKVFINLTKPFFISPQKGAKTSIFIAKSNKDELQSGGYYDKKKLKKPSSKAEDVVLQDKLYDFSLQQLEEILS